MLMTKSDPKLRFENDLSKKMQFSADFSKNVTEHPSTISITYGIGLNSEFKPISI